jgi:hypothetical protein
MSQMSPHYLINGKNKKKKELLNIKCVFRFSLEFLSETFFIIRRTEQDMIKMYIGLHVKYPYSCEILEKLKYSRQSFEKYSKTKFHANLSSGSRVVPCGQTEESQTWRS